MRATKQGLNKELLPFFERKWKTKASHLFLLSLVVVNDRGKTALMHKALCTYGLFIMNLYSSKIFRDRVVDECLK